MIRRPRLGLTLGGGGARGGAHVGVLRVLEEVGYEPDVVTGTSIGGVAAAFVAAGWSAARIEEVIRELDFGALLNFDRTGRGLIGNHALAAALKDYFGDADLRDLPRPVAVVAADLRRGERILLDRGPVVKALLATTSVPGAMPPIEWGDRLLVDGGIVSNVPTQATFELGANRQVAVDVGGHLDLELALNDVGVFGARLQRLLGWLVNASHRQMVIDAFIQGSILSHNLLVSYELMAFPPDVLIKPDLPAIGLLGLDRIVDSIEPGEEAARAAIPRIRALLNRRRMPRRGYPLPPLVRIERE